VLHLGTLAAEERSVNATEPLKDLSERAVLRGHPYQDKERCANCLYYLDPGDEISYCWHPQLRILVGADWWCQWWDAIPAE
jgi:hypothetical protein